MIPKAGFESQQIWCLSHALLQMDIDTFSFLSSRTSKVRLFTTGYQHIGTPLKDAIDTF